MINYIRNKTLICRRKLLLAHFDCDLTDLEPYSDPHHCCDICKEQCKCQGNSCSYVYFTTTIGTWNVRTMYETDKTAKVATEMRNYRLSILGITESRRTGSGQRRLISGELLLFSGHEQENASHTQGVALMLSRTAQMALIGWEGHGLRIITATFRTNERRINMDVIQCYAPTNDSDDQDKEEFYNRLLTIIQDRPE